MVVHRVYAILLTNGGRNVSNRFVTKIEDDFSSSLSSSPSSLSLSLSLALSLSFCCRPISSFLCSVCNGGGTFAVRCCDDATGTYMVIMWHGCRSRVVGSHQEALSYGEGGPHPQGPPVKPMQRGPRVWHAAHPRMHGARLRGIPAGFFHRSLLPVLIFLRRRLHSSIATSFRRDGLASKIGEIDVTVILSLKMCKFLNCEDQIHFFKFQKSLVDGLC